MNLSFYRYFDKYMQIIQMLINEIYNIAVLKESGLWTNSSIHYLTLKNILFRLPL